MWVCKDEDEVEVGEELSALRTQRWRCDLAIDRSGGHLSPCRKRSPAKGVWQKSDKKSHRSIGKSDRKSPENEKKVIELLLPASFQSRKCAINSYWTKNSAGPLG